MRKRVCIDPGHGGSQPGAVFRGLKEKDVVLKVAKYAAEDLRALDAELWVGLTRQFDQTLSLQQRCDFSNNIKVDCFVSVHCNADPDEDLPGMSEARGEEIWYCDESIKGLKLAQCLKDEVDLIFPDEPFRGLKKTEGLYVLKHTNAPAALIEIGFIDRLSSAEVFSDEPSLRKMGALIARGIYNYLGLK